MTNPFNAQGPGFGVPGSGSQDVNRLHDYDDIDVGTLSHHHSLGILSGQASPGDHIHDGKVSKKLGSVSIVSETTWGLPVTPGVSNTLSKGDHSHGSPVKPVSTLDAAASGDLVLNGVFADVPGMTVAVTTSFATAQVLINATLDVDTSVALAGALIFGQVLINGVVQTGEIRGDARTVRRDGSSNTWARVIGIAAGQIIKIQAKLTGAGGTITVKAIHSRMTVLVCNV